MQYVSSLLGHINIKRKRKRSDSVLWQKPLHQQKCQKGKVTTQTTPQKSSIIQRLRTDLGRSVEVTTATQLVWLTGLRAHLPTNRNSRLIKRTQKQKTKTKNIKTKTLLYDNHTTKCKSNHIGMHCHSGIYHHLPLNHCHYIEITHYTE